MIPKLLLFIALFSNITLAQDSKADFYKSSKWLSLNRYVKNIFGVLRSEIDSKNFFIDSDGKYSPEKELIATLNKFRSDKDIICKYPARYMLLKKENLVKGSFDLNKCKKLKELKEKLNLKSISLIFSSYFIERPASAFGHTFFRLKTKSNNSENELLDYGLDFAATVDTKNPLMYGIKGILGGFKGQFNLVPYYKKLREYNDFESRDIWDYEINLTEYELDYFIANLIEMNRAYFDYFYFDENCSYHVLGLLNSIKPEWKLMESLSLSVPPVDTLYAIEMNSNVVKRKTFFPSKFKIFKERVRQMSDNELKELKELINGSKFQGKNSESIQAYSDFIDYKYIEDLTSKKANSIQERKFDLNLYRSKNKVNSRNLNFEKEHLTSPEKGHRTRRIRLGSIYNNDENELNGLIEYRFTLHDYIDPSIGFIPFSSTEMGKLKLRSYKEKLRMSEFQIVNVEANRPINYFQKNMSWKFSFGIEDNLSFHSQQYIPNLKFDLGGGFRFQNLLLSMFLSTDSKYFSKSNNNFNFEIGPRFLVGMISNLYNLKFFYTRKKVFNRSENYLEVININSQFNFSKTIGMFLNSTINKNKNNQFELGLSHYF